MAEVFEVLGADHAEYEKLIAALAASAGSLSTMDESDLAARASVIEWLTTDYLRHLSAEDEFMWPVVSRCLPAERDLVAEAINGQRHLAAILTRLSGLSADEPDYDRLVSELVVHGRRHIELEEERIWPELRKVLAQGESERLGDLAHQARGC